MKGGNFLWLMFFGVGLLLLGGGGIVGGAAPFPAEKLSVVVLHDSSKVGSVPVWVDGADVSAVRGWVESVGGEFRLLDPDNKDNEHLADKWKAAAAVPHASLPWMAGATPRRGISEALPVKREDALSHLAPLGGS